MLCRNGQARQVWVGQGEGDPLTDGASLRITEFRPSPQAGHRSNASTRALSRCCLRLSDSPFSRDANSSASTAPSPVVDVPPLSFSPGVCTSAPAAVLGGSGTAAPPGASRGSGAGTRLKGGCPGPDGWRQRRKPAPDEVILATAVSMCSESAHKSTVATWYVNNTATQDKNCASHSSPHEQRRNGMIVRLSDYRRARARDSWSGSPGWRICLRKAAISSRWATCRAKIGSEEKREANHRRYLTV